LIEVTTASLFLGIFHGFTLCQTAFVTNPLCMLTTPFGFGSLLFLYCVSFIFFSIFIIDYEYQIIPDILSLLLFVASFLYILLTGADAFWVHMLCGFLASLFLLILHIGTKGRGMGLGDVKIALSFGILLGYPFTITWLFVSFILGSIIGIILLTFRKVQFGMHIPFGPFLIAAYFVVLFWGDTITKFIIPYLY
jgi:leader peptidase (prepilin peptidase)/N-methyltransferase